MFKFALAHSSSNVQLVGRLHVAHTLMQRTPARLRKDRAMFGYLALTGLGRLIRSQTFRHFLVHHCHILTHFRRWLGDRLSVPVGICNGRLLLQ